MSIVDSENQLFEEWRKVRPDLVMDGVADESKYIQSKPRLLFIKELANHHAGWESDQRQFMRDGASLTVWDNLARWTRGIRALPTVVLWRDVKNIGLEERGQEIASIAVMNLRKSCTVLNKKSAAAAERRFLNRQFALYDAEVVVLCGSAVPPLFEKLIDLDRRGRRQFTTLAMIFRRFGRKKVVVQQFPPQIQGHSPYYALIHALNEILWGIKVKPVLDAAKPCERKT